MKGKFDPATWFTENSTALNLADQQSQALSKQRESDYKDHVALLKWLYPNDFKTPETAAKAIVTAALHCFENEDEAVEMYGYLVERFSQFHKDGVWS